jgi:Flp pilus assembly secretin CpaC
MFELRHGALALAAATVTACLCPAQPAFAQTHLISLSVGSSSIVPAPGMTRVAVGDGSIAGIVPTGNQLVINGKAPGRTTVAIWTRSERQDYEVVVTEPSLDSVEQVIRQSLNIPGVAVSQSPGTIFVTGNVTNTTQQAHVNEVLGRFDGFAKDKKVSIVNAVTIANPLADVNRAMSADAGLSHVHVDADGKGNLVVSGSVHDRAQAEVALGRVRSIAGTALSSDGKIIDRISTDTTTQIAIKVNILEIDRTGLQQLGIRLQGANPDPNNPGAFNIVDPNFVAVEGAGSSAPGHALNVSPFFRLTRLAPTLDLIVQSGHARVLSAPDLVTSPGQAASFLVGGEVPYAYSTGLGNTSIVFKEYGVKLDMTPTLLPDGTVETKIAPEVSDLDFQSGITLQGFIVPALKTSKLKTDIVTHDGDSVVMGGLLRHIEQKNINKIPGLGDLPVLGKLFRSTRYSTSQTDVVFVMTPDVIVR